MNGYSTEIKTNGSASSHYCMTLSYLSTADVLSQDASVHGNVHKKSGHTQYVAILAAGLVSHP